MAIPLLFEVLDVIRLFIEITRFKKHTKTLDIFDYLLSFTDHFLTGLSLIYLSLFMFDIIEIFSFGFIPKLISILLKGIKDILETIFMDEDNL